MAYIYQDRYNIGDILDGLSMSDMSEEDRDDIISSLYIYYRKSVRHNYHEITRYIIRKYSSVKEEETTNVILDNVDNILKYIKDNWECSNDDCYAIRDCVKLDSPASECKLFHNTDIHNMSCSEWKELYRFVIKLKDHIFLEVIRLSEIRNENDKIEREMLKLHDTEKRIGGMEGDLEKKVEKVSKETKDVYIQMVSILGIFAAIVIAVFGGMNVIGSIVSGFTSINAAARLNVVFSSMLISTFIVDVIYVLLAMINNAMDKKSPLLANIVVIGMNIICVLVTIFALLN